MATASPTPTVDPQVHQLCENFRRDYRAVQAEIAKAIVGHEDIIDGVLTCLFVGGHALLEGVPGLGKTALIRALSQALNLKFSRIQFTPDLMPADVIGTNVIMENEQGKRGFQFMTGPIFAQIVLADEINRATPKTQSALLEAMQEKQVTVDGERIKAHQQLIKRVVIAPHVRDFAIRCTLATHPQGQFAIPMVNQFLRVGASPRAAQAITLAAKVRALLDGRFHVSFQDVKEVTVPAMRHRVILNFEGEAEGITTDMVLEKVVAETPT